MHSNKLNIHVDCLFTCLLVANVVYVRRVTGNTLTMGWQNILIKSSPFCSKLNADVHTYIHINNTEEDLNIETFNTSENKICMLKLRWNCRNRKLEGIHFYRALSCNRIGNINEMVCKCLKWQFSSCARTKFKRCACKGCFLWFSTFCNAKKTQNWKWILSILYDFAN